MNKKNSYWLSKDELYGFADEKFVYNLQKKYAKYFKKGPVIDLGCGRGIFLQILRESNLEGIGVDNSNFTYEYSKTKDLKIYKDDVFQFLKKFTGEKNKTYGIFCSHFIEHLTPQKVQELLYLCFDALEVGGILLVITPNPMDLRVMTNIFWLDQTHIRPYPLDLLKALFLKVGFKINQMGVDKDTEFKHSKNFLFDKISKFILGKSPLGVYVNTGCDIYIVGEKPRK